MSPKLFFSLVSLLLVGSLIFLFFHTIPPSTIFHRSTPVTTSLHTLPTPTPNSLPHPYPLLAPLSASSGWSTQQLPEQKIQFDFPTSWGSPSASLTQFSFPSIGTLTGIYFITNRLEDTPVFLEITSPNYKLAASASALFTATQNNITNSIISENNSTVYHTYYSLPNFHLKVYVYLPQIQNHLPQDNLENYFNATSQQIFSGIGLTATDSANLRDSQKLVKSIRFL